MSLPKGWRLEEEPPLPEGWRLENEPPPLPKGWTLEEDPAPKPAVADLVPAMFSGGAFTMPAGAFDAIASPQSAVVPPGLTNAVKLFASETGATGWDSVAGLAGLPRAYLSKAVDAVAWYAVSSGAMDQERASRRAAELKAELDKRPAMQATEAAAANARDTAAFIRDNSGADPALADTLLAKLAAGAGSLPAAIGTGPVAPLVIAGMMGEQTRRDAAESLATRGLADPDEVRRATDGALLAGAPVGALSEALLGAPALLKSVRAMQTGRTAAGRVAAQVGLGAGREGVQEAIEQLAQNVTAKDVVGYDPERERTEGLGEAALLGALIGGPVGGAFQAAQEVDARRAHGDYARQLDTDKNIPEATKTLLLQEDQLRRGLRPAMMFPSGTPVPLELPEGMERLVTQRGVFHFNPKQISKTAIERLSAAGRENEILGLGPISKPEAEARAQATGEPLVAVTERAPDGTEVKAAVGTTATAPAQVAALGASASPGNVVRVEDPAAAILARVRARQDEANAATRAQLAAEEAARQERQLAADARKQQVEDAFTLADQVLAGQAAPTFGQIKGIRKSLEWALDDTSIGLDTARRQRAAALLKQIEPTFTRLAKEEDAEAALRIEAAKREEANKAAARKLARRAEIEALDAIQQTGRDPREGNVITDITRVPDEEFFNELPNNLEAEGLDQKTWDREALRRQRQQELGDEGAPNFTLADVFTGANGAKAWIGSKLRLPTAAALREAGDPLAGDMESIQEDLPFSWFTSKSGRKLDSLVESLRGYGFEINTPAELLEALRAPEDVRPRVSGVGDSQVEFAQGDAAASVPTFSQVVDALAFSTDKDREKARALVREFDVLPEAEALRWVESYPLTRPTRQMFMRYWNRGRGPAAQAAQGEGRTEEEKSLREAIRARMPLAYPQDVDEVVRYIGAAADDLGASDRAANRGVSPLLGSRFWQATRQASTPPPSTQANAIDKYERAEKRLRSVIGMRRRDPGDVDDAVRSIAEAKTEQEASKLADLLRIGRPYAIDYWNARRADKSTRVNATRPRSAAQPNQEPDALATLVAFRDALKSAGLPPHEIEPAIGRVAAAGERDIQVMDTLPGSARGAAIDWWRAVNGRSIRSKQPKPSLEQITDSPNEAESRRLARRLAELGYQTSGNLVFDPVQWERVTNGRNGYAVTERPEVYSQSDLALAEAYNRAYQAEMDANRRRNSEPPRQAQPAPPENSQLAARDQLRNHLEQTGWGAEADTIISQIDEADTEAAVEKAVAPATYPFALAYWRTMWDAPPATIAQPAPPPPAPDSQRSVAAIRDLYDISDEQASRRMESFLRLDALKAEDTLFAMERHGATSSMLEVLRATYEDITGRRIGGLPPAPPPPLRLPDGYDYRIEQRPGDDGEGWYLVEDATDAEVIFLGETDKDPRMIMQRAQDIVYDVVQDNDENEGLPTTEIRRRVAASIRPMPQASTPTGWDRVAGTDSPAVIDPGPLAAALATERSRSRAWADQALRDLRTMNIVDAGRWLNEQRDAGVMVSLIDRLGAYYDQANGTGEYFGQAGVPRTNKRTPKEPANPDPQLEQAGRFFREIATQERAWQFGREGDPRRQSKILSDVAATYSTRKLIVEGTWHADRRFGNIAVYHRKADDSRGSRIGGVSLDLGDDNEIRVGATGANSNQDADMGGKNMYQSIFTWAHNNGYRVLGNSLSPVNQVRRTVNMLSSALRHGTTAHIVPYGTQRIDGWINGGPEVFDHNIGAMLRALSVQLSERTKGRLDALTYDPASDMIVDNVNGRRISEDDLRRIIETAKLHEDGFGPATARAVLAGRAQLAAHSRGQGPDLARARDAAQSGGLQGVLYSRGAASQDGADRPGAERGREAGQPRALPRALAGEVAAPTWREAVASQLTDAEIDATLGRLRGIFPALASTLDLKVGDLEQLLSAARTPAGQSRVRIGVPRNAEAAVTPDVNSRRLLIAIASHIARQDKITPRFLHEIGHKYWDVLPDYAKDFLRQLHRQQVTERTGPLFDPDRRDAQGRPRPYAGRPLFLAEDLPADRLARDPDLPIKEWFCESLAALNQDWLNGRIDSKLPPPLVRIWQKFKDFLARIFAAERRLDPASEVFQRAFRQWLDAGDITTATTAQAFARGDAAQFAQFASNQATFDLGGIALGLELPDSIRNLTPKWQDKTLRFESNFDKALYYAGSEGRSATKDGIIAHLERETGLSRGEIATLARDLRRKLGALARGVARDGTLRVPPQMQAEARALTGVSFAEGEEQTELQIDDVNLPAAASEEQRAVALFARRYNALHQRIQADRDSTMLEVYVRLGQRAETLLDNAIPSMTDEEIVELANAVGVDSAASALILRAAQRARGWRSMALVFQSGSIHGGTAGEIVNERSRLTDYGPLEMIHESPETITEDGESRLMRAWRKTPQAEKSAYEIRGATRNELKFALWGERTTMRIARGMTDIPAHRYVSEAISSPREKFLRSVSSDAARLIMSRTGLTPEAFWRAAKEGDVALVNELAQKPSTLRRQYARAGRYVGPIKTVGALPTTRTPRVFAEQASLEFAEGELFEGDAAGDADRTTIGDYLVAADRFREETPKVPEGSALDKRRVRDLAPYLISGNKGDIVGKHGRFIETLARGATRVLDAFGGAAIYSHYLAARDALPAGSVWNEWEYTRSITNRQIAADPDAVSAELRSLRDEFAAAFPEPAPQAREQMLALRQRIKDWMDARLRDLVPDPQTDAEGRLVLPDTARTAAFYLFAQNHMTQGRVVDFELMDGRATFATGGKANGKDDFNFVDEDGWKRPARVWQEDAPDGLRSAAERLRRVEVRQGDGWLLAAEAPAGALVFVDSSYFQSDREMAEGKMVMNYGTGTLADGQWDQWLEKARQRLVPRGDEVRYVVTNNFNAQVVAELENDGWTILRTTRRNKTGEAHELVALSPAAARSAGIARGIRTQARPDSRLLATNTPGRRGELRPSGGSGAAPELDIPPGDERAQRAIALKASLPAGVTTAAALEAEQEATRAEDEKRLSEAARAARHPAAQGDPAPGEAWDSVARLTPEQITAEIRAISEYLNDNWLDLAAIERARLQDRQTGLRAEIERRKPAERRQAVSAAVPQPVIPKPNRRDALLDAWRQAKKLREDANKTGNDTAWAEAQEQVSRLKRTLDDEFPDWETDAYETPGAPANAPEPQPAAPATPGPRRARADQVEQDDGRNISTPPPEAPEAGAPIEDEPAPDRGRANEVFGQTATTPTWWERSWETARRFVVGFRGSIPELPAMPQESTDAFTQRFGPTFYNRLKEGVRALASANDYVQRTAEEKVSAITSPLMELGGRFSADDYARLQSRQEQARRLRADNRPVPPGVQAEIDALHLRLQSHPYYLFNRLVFFMDLEWRWKNLKDSAGNPIRLPGNLNGTEIQNEINRIATAVAASPHAKAIETAYMRHLDLVKSIVEDIKRRDLLAAQHLENPAYFPHLTLEIREGDKVKQRELRPDRVRVGTEADFRGYLIEPVGSDKPIESDYVKAMYYHLVQVTGHNLKADTVRDLFRSYDIRPDVEKRAKALTRADGRAVGWEEAFHREYAKEGYVLYGTDSRDAFPSIQVDREKLARRLGVILTSEDLHQQLDKLSLQNIRLLPSDLRETLVQGEREIWVVPARVAEALRAIADRQSARQDNPIEAALRMTNSYWKQWKLFMPMNHLRYEYGNVVADLEKVFSASPGTFKKLPQAAREMREFFQGGVPSDDLRAALKDGVINAITAQELNQLQRLRAFEKFETTGEKIAAQLKRRGSSAIFQGGLALAGAANNAARVVTGKPIGDWQLGLGDLSSVELSAFREGTTRYANYLANLEAIRAGARPAYAGAYWQDVEAIQDSRPGAGDRAHRQAAQIAKATFGDYGDLSVNGQYLRDKLIPFYSWIEINFRYHANLLRNNYDLLRGRGTTAQGAAATARQASALVGGFALRLALPYAAIMLWNALGSGIDDDELSEADRRRFHIRVGRDDEGRPIIIYANTALADVTKWFGGPKLGEAFGAWQRGETDFITALSEWASSVPGDSLNEAVGSAGPTVKLPAMVITGRNFFPDAFDSRKIPDYDMRRAIIAQITDDFTADQIERIVNEDYSAPRDYATWARQLILQMRRRDPEQWAFYGTKQKADEWMSDRTGQKRGSDYDAPDQQVLRNFRRAIYQGDLEQASKFYLRLLDFGYTAERFQASIRASEPLHAIPRAQRKEFVASLNEIERTQLDRAYAYWMRLDSMRGLERGLFPTREAVERGNVRQAERPRIDLLERSIARRELMDEDEVMRRADAALRRSLAGNN